MLMLTTMLMLTMLLTNNFKVQMKYWSFWVSRQYLVGVINILVLFVFIYKVELHELICEKVKAKTTNYWKSSE